MFFKKFPEGACPQTPPPLGSSRFTRSKGALWRQKYVTSGASTNMSATLQNCQNPCPRQIHDTQLQELKLQQQKVELELQGEIAEVDAETHV